MARSIVDICNEALGEVPADQISDLDDDTVASARHCKRLLPSVISDLLEYHDWDFAVRRSALAAVANSRAGEWAFAYALPFDIRSPRHIIPQLDGPVAAGAHRRASMAGQLLGDIRYVIADGVLYTDIEGASLEYVADNIAVTAFTSMFSRAVVVELASRLVMPLINERGRQRELIQLAEIEKQRAVADDVNRNPQRADDFISDRDRARGVDYGLGYGYCR